MTGITKLEKNCYDTGLVARNLREEAKDQHKTILDVGESYIAAAILVAADRQAKEIQEAMNSRH